MNDQRGWRLHIGANVQDGGVQFRIWAPKCRSVDAVIENRPSPAVVPLTPEGNGYFSAVSPQAAPGDLYRYQVDREKSYPDPASRFQPEVRGFLAHKQSR